MIEKLKKQLETQKSQESKPQNQNKAKIEAVEDAPQYISIDEFLTFRKEMIEKVRDLEDEVISLKYKMNLLKNQLSSR